MWCLEVIKKMNTSESESQRPSPDLVDYDGENVVFLPRKMYDSALVGMSYINGYRVAVYDKDKIIDILAKSWLSDPTYGESEDTAYEEALEYYCYNIEGSLGAGYPIYVSRQDLDVFLEEVDDVGERSSGAEEER